ncbi:putative transcription regulator protein [Euzebya pacifica]|uniref:Putative transcription regulator protein n=1 Tax=Euzebya pacifica TaxID=1608957 RepID=A0A346XV55_9ACTN|nr:MerR family transcriptional regulator [Euzebya pacifica]AXV06102.1 putative transcription regulator protein [Euzebya pacifica]
MARGSSMTIDDLAATTGVSSRSIRYYQTRGLLPPPRVKGRQGFYGQKHVDRLNLITELAEEGLNLQAIGWLIGGASRVDSDELRRLKRAVLDGWVSDEPVSISAKDLSKALAGGTWDEGTAARAAELGLLEELEDGEQWRILLPSVLAAGGELADMGLPPERMLDVLETIREHVTPIAAAYVQVFDEAVLAPWDARGRPEGEWSAIREAVDRIRPLAGEALLAVFRQVMTDVITDLMAGTDEEDAGDAS